MMTQMIRWCAALALLLVAACASDETDGGTCEAGEERACSCLDAVGLQTCDAEGAWGECACGRLGDVAADAAADSGFDASTGADAAAEDGADAAVSPDAGGDSATEPPGEAPRAACRCRLQGTDDWLQSVSVYPLDTLECSAAQSTSEGAIAEWSWRVEERPEGSASEPQPADAERMEFFVDAAGSFEIACAVRDEFGRQSALGCDTDGDGVADEGCTDAREDLVSVRSFVRHDLLVEISWDTPADPDDTDQGFGAGADLDLHLLHPNGCWNDERWDCHYRNHSTDWGEAQANGCEIDIDSTDGVGPEVTRVYAVEEVRYVAGVHFYNDHGFGLSEVNARIFLFGEELLTATRELPTTDFWWVIAEIDAATGVVTPIDRVYAPDEIVDGRPPCADDAEESGEGSAEPGEGSK